MSRRTNDPSVDASEVTQVLAGAARRWFRLHPKAVDVLVVILCLVGQIAVLALVKPLPVWPGLIVALCSSLPLLWRRPSPMPVLCLVVVISTVAALLPPGEVLPGFAVAVAVYTLAARRPLAWAALGYAVAVVVPALGALMHFLLTGQVHAPSLLDPLALLALVIGVASRNAMQRRAALAELLNERLATARALERNQITAEMHDIVAHSISTMIALADGASSGWRTHPDRAAKALEHLGEVGRDALTDMRRILHLLREGDPALGHGLAHSGHNVPDLHDLIEVFRSAGLPVRLTRVGPKAPEDPALTTTVYRIVQESLTNALRYATGTTRVDVRIETSQSSLTVLVSDDGRSVLEARHQGSRRGLVGIAERAAAYGGSSAAGPRPDGGWSTTATLQLDKTTDRRRP